MKVSKLMPKYGSATLQSVLDRIDKLPKDRQAAVISKLFGDEAPGVFGILGTDLARDALREVAVETKYAGSALEDYRIRSQTTANRLKLFNNGVTELSRSLGDILKPQLEQLMETLTPIIRRVTEWIKANPKLVGGISKIAAGLVSLREFSKSLQQALGQETADRIRPLLDVLRDVGSWIASARGGSTTRRGRGGAIGEDVAPAVREIIAAVESLAKTAKEASQALDRLFGREPEPVPRPLAAAVSSEPLPGELGTGSPMAPVMPRTGPSTWMGEGDTAAPPATPPKRTSFLDQFTLGNVWASTLKEVAGIKRMPQPLPTRSPDVQAWISALGDGGCARKAAIEAWVTCATFPCRMPGSGRNSARSASS